MHSEDDEFMNWKWKSVLIGTFDMFPPGFYYGFIGLYFSIGVFEIYITLGITSELVVLHKIVFDIVVHLLTYRNALIQLSSKA